MVSHRARQSTAQLQQPHYNLWRRAHVALQRGVRVGSLLAAAAVAEQLAAAARAGRLVKEPRLPDSIRGATFRRLE